METMKEHGVSSIARKLRTPLIISLFLVLPFMILELINLRSSQQGFPVVLFALMWLLTFAFILILMPIVRSLRGENRNLKNPITLLPNVVLLTLIAGILVSLIIDQMPCFLGIPNCD